PCAHPRRLDQTGAVVILGRALGAAFTTRCSRRPCRATRGRRRRPSSAGGGAPAPRPPPTPPLDCADATQPAPPPPAVEPPAPAPAAFDAPLEPPAPLDEPGPVGVPSGNAGRFVDTPLEIVLSLEHAELRRHESEGPHLPLGKEAQGSEVSTPRVVVFEKIRVDV